MGARCRIGMRSSPISKCMARARSSIPRLDDAAKFPIAARERFGHVVAEKDQITPALPALHLYQLALKDIARSHGRDRGSRHVTAQCHARLDSNAGCDRRYHFSDCFGHTLITQWGPPPRPIRWRIYISHVSKRCHWETQRDDSRALHSYNRCARNWRHLGKRTRRCHGNQPLH